MNQYFKLLLSSFLLFLLFFIKSIDAKNSCEESNAKSCSECMAVPGCAWCEHPDYANNPNIIISRCNMPDVLEKDECPPEKIINITSTFERTVDNALSNVGESAVGKATQLKPQVVTANLRPGMPISVNISYKQAEDYPVDLYYLLDLSRSMKDDLESLRKLGKKLGDSMSSITRDFRLGFGSFVDKTVMPYISMVPNKQKNPCTEQDPCVPAYSFSNDLPLTVNLDAFTSSVNNVSYSSNLDAPEGGFDAMMQAIVCKSQIKWRDQATRLLVYSSDATFHYAGDGKLGGIVVPNDGMCYLDSAGKRYTMANEMDYPSVGHLVQKILDHNIQPIFAVTTSVIQTYTKLHEMIPKSAVGELSGDSSNVIDLIKEAYENLKGEIVLKVSAPEGIVVEGKQAHCKSGTVDGELKCLGVQLGDIVNFTLSISSTKCFDEPQVMNVSIVGYTENIKIIVHSNCDCECDAGSSPNNCSGHGAYDCGACVCLPGYLGLDCSCDKKDIVGVESYLKNCTQPGTEKVCNERGECLCGQCVCNQASDRTTYGKYCQCDDASCDRYNGKMCNGHGKCDCGNCICEDGWKGDRCECTKDNTGCIDPAKENGIPCEGAGECVCGECQCNVTKNGLQYRGTYCEISPSQLCEIHKDCVLCLAYGTGNQTACEEQCTQYTVVMLESTASQLRSTCRVVDDSNDCSVTFYFEKDGDKIKIETDLSTKVCPVIMNPMFFIIGIIAAIVGIGLAILLIWKLWTSIKDAREYKQWEKDVQKAKWETSENPIYKAATSTHANPTYNAGKPTSQL